jgi:N-ethylmaleimide reductase
VAAAIATEIGAGRTGVRLSPVSTAGDSVDSDPQSLFEHVVSALDTLGLGYIHVVEGETGGARDNLPFDFAALRKRFHGTWIANNGYDRAMAIDEIASGRADLVAFGRPFIANPDLVRRLREDRPLNPLMGQETLYGGGAHGYTDYPSLDEIAEPIATATPAAV